MSVRVVARIRPLLKSELEKDIILRADTSSGDSGSFPTLVHIPNPKKESELYNFQFNRVYGSESTQQDVFESEGKDKASKRATPALTAFEFRRLLSICSMALT